MQVPDLLNKFIHMEKTKNRVKQTTTHKKRRKQRPVYVLNMRGEPLMPCSPGKAGILLRDVKAVIHSYKPFALQLTIPAGENKQDLTLGVDLGSKELGLSASTAKAEKFAEETELRSDITKLPAERREHRQRRRSGLRYREPRFNNRVHNNKEGWLPPSVKNKEETTLNLINKVLEVALFDIQKIKNPDIEGKEYQEGPRKDFDKVKAYVRYRDNYTCQHCKGKSKAPLLEVHHIESRKTGGDSPDNLITLCKTCHDKVHHSEIELKHKRGKSFRDATGVSILSKTVVDALRAEHPDIEICITYGYITKHKRIKHHLPKSHHVDAFCISGNFGTGRMGCCCQTKQVRRHNRKIHKSTILKGGKRKLNQAPKFIKGFQLFDKLRIKDTGEFGFIFGRRISGCFDVRRLDGTVISRSISYKKLKLIEMRSTYLTQVQEESASSLV